jgi:hypothetical protein
VRYNKGSSKRTENEREDEFFRKKTVAGVRTSEQQDSPSKRRASGECFPWSSRRRPMAGGILKAYAYA